MGRDGHATERAGERTWSTRNGTTSGGGALCSAVCPDAWREEDDFLAVWILESAEVRFW